MEFLYFILFCVLILYTFVASEENLDNSTNFRNLSSSHDETKNKKRNKRLSTMMSDSIKIPYVESQRDTYEEMLEQLEQSRNKAKIIKQKENIIKTDFLEPINDNEKVNKKPPKDKKSEILFGISNKLQNYYYEDDGCYWVESIENGVECLPIVPRPSAKKKRDYLLDVAKDYSELYDSPSEARLGSDENCISAFLDRNVGIYYCNSAGKKNTYNKKQIKSKDMENKKIFMDYARVVVPTIPFTQRYVPSKREVKEWRREQKLSYDDQPKYNSNQGNLVKEQLTLEKKRKAQVRVVKNSSDNTPIVEGPIIIETDGFWIAEKPKEIDLETLIKNNPKFV